MTQSLIRRIKALTHHASETPTLDPTKFHRPQLSRGADAVPAAPAAPTEAEATEAVAVTTASPETTENPKT